MSKLEDSIEKIGKEHPFKDVSELGEVMTNLDSQEHIDLNSNLNDIQINAIKVIDELKSLGIFPEEANITKQTKRLSVSREGEGRKQKVEIAQGMVKARGGGMGENLKDLFRRREANE